MKHLLDTDHISFLQRRSAPEHAILVTRMSERPLTDFVFSVVSFHEQALALSRNLIVLTRNERDFGRVPGLLTEDWTV